MYKKRHKLTSTSGYTITNATTSNPSYPATRTDNEFLSMSLQERAHIASYHVKGGFKPTSGEQPTDEFKKKYSQEWWNTKVCFLNDNGEVRSGDVAAFVANACIFPERSQEGWEESRPSPVDFYTVVTRDNALDWYEGCPSHLRKVLDSEIEKVTEAEKALPSSPIYQAVRDNWGDRIEIRYFPGTQDHANGYLELDLRNQWLHEYDKEAAIDVCVNTAPRMQKERKMLSQALGLKQGGNGLPSQAEGLDTTQAATVRWLESSGETPLEYLTSVYRDATPEVRVSDKIAAARALLDYVHRKVPATVEVKGPSSEDIAGQAAIVREVGEQLAVLAALNKKSEK